MKLRKYISFHPTKGMVYFSEKGANAMDVAAMSVMLHNQQLQADAGLKVMSKAKNLMEQQGEQLVEMLQTSEATTPHPTSGKSIDVSV